MARKLGRPRASWLQLGGPSRPVVENEKFAEAMLLCRDGAARCAADGACYRDGECFRIDTEPPRLEERVAALERAVFAPQKEGGKS